MSQKDKATAIISKIIDQPNQFTKKKQETPF